MLVKNPLVYFEAWEMQTFGYWTVNHPSVVFHQGNINGGVPRTAEEFTESGVMQTGWLELDDTWYYFEPSGIMARDQWHGDYYLLASGAMAKNAWIGPYYVDDNGVWAPNAQR